MRIREIAIGALLAGLLAGGVALTVPPPQAPTVAASPTTPAARATQPQAPISAGVAPLQGARAQVAPSWREMHAKYARAPNLRGFFYEVLRRPDDSAIFYAFGALDICKRALSKASFELGGERAAAAQALRQRCDFTAEGLEDAERELRAVRNLELRDDPLLESTVSYLGADGPEGRAKVLLAVFEQGDPRLLASLLTPAIEASAEPDANADALSLPVAAALLACRLGADCGPDALRTLELCMTRGWCADSVPAALRQGLGKQFAAIDRPGMGRRD